MDNDFKEYNDQILRKVAILDNIDDIMCLLSWKRSPDDQAKGMQLAMEVKCLKAFFQPICDDYSKDVWDNCASIIVQHSDNELVPYLTDMLLWLQDMNWPGADRILGRLLTFSDMVMLSKLVSRFTIALNATEDYSWLFSIAQLMENSELAISIDSKAYDILITYFQG